MVTTLRNWLTDSGIRVPSVLLEDAGDRVVLTAESYRRLRERARVAEALLADQREQTESAHAWGVRNGQETRRAYDRLTLVAAAAAAEGVSMMTINATLADDETYAGIVSLVADEAEGIIADGDRAEVAAPVPGEVGRGTVIDRRDAIYNDPVTWLRGLVQRARG